MQKQECTIPESAYTLEFSRSSGPGGQNVNRRETRVVLRFNIRDYNGLTEEQKERIIKKAGHKVVRDDKGNSVELIFSESSFRTQEANRKRVEEKFQDFIRKALEPEKERKKTRISRSAKEKRLKEKKEISEKKKFRKPIEGEF